MTTFSALPAIDCDVTGNVAAGLRPAGQPADHLTGTLPEMVAFSLRRYLSQVDPKTLAACGNLHEMVMASVEQALIREVLASVDNNQVKAAAMLGISRNTLRKRLG